jgi:hypothetical protein
MSNTERRQIEELVALYQLEPGIRDVFVEGATDVAFLDWFLHATGLTNALVREIAAVDVPPDLVNGLGLQNNNRGRLIALARRVQSELGHHTVALTCVADSDFDRVLQNEYSCNALLLTDYSSLEAYLFLSGPMSKLLRLVVRRFPKPADRVLAEIGGPLVELFAIRLANHCLDWNLRMIAFDSCCELEEGAVHFDQTEYLTRLLNANARAGDREAFTRALGEARRLLTRDTRHYVHGHDFVGMLNWYLRRHRCCRGITRDMIERVIYACVETSDVASEPMFMALRERLLA